jgi:hypothetical protein
MTTPTARLDQTDWPLVLAAPALAQVAVPVTATGSLGGSQATPSVHALALAEGVTLLRPQPYQFQLATGASPSDALIRERHGRGQIVNRRHSLALTASFLAVLGVTAWSPAAASESDGFVPPSIVQALDSATPAQQEQIYEGLTSDQKLAVSTPGSAVLSAGPTDADESVPVSGTLASAAPLELVGNASNCSPGTRFIPWVLTVKAFAGNTLYKWHLDMQWHWDCKKITSLDYHFGYVTDVFFLETYKGKVTDTMTGQGLQAGEAEAQGRVAYCVHIFGIGGCFAETDPVIDSHFDAFGGASATGSV